MFAVLYTFTKSCLGNKPLNMSCISFFSFLFIRPQPKPKNAVTIAVSSRTLFNMKAERKIFEEEGLEKYVAFQQEHENEPLKPGPAFPFVKVCLGPWTVKPAAGLCRACPLRSVHSLLQLSVIT